MVGYTQHRLYTVKTQEIVIFIAQLQATHPRTRRPQSPLVNITDGKGKVIPLQVRCGPEGG